MSYDDVISNFSLDIGENFSRNDLLHIQANRKPFLFMDSAHNVVPNKQAGSKFLFRNEWDIFNVHFAGTPMVPASIMIEMMMQTAALAPIISIKRTDVESIPLVFLTSVDKASFKEKIPPNSEVEVRSIITWIKGKFGKCSAVIIDNQGRNISRANFQFFCNF